MKKHTKTTALLFTCVFYLISSHFAQAIKMPYSKELLEQIATDIVVGKVQAIYSRTEREGKYEYVHKVAEVKIEKIEKGKVTDELIYVRYFDRHWIGKGLLPPGAASYSPQPTNGGICRFYLSRDAYDGWSLDGGQDGGFNVVYVNGIQPVQE